MPFPGVNVNVTNGNLLKEINAADCVPGLLVTVKTPSLVAKVLKVYSLADAEKSGITQQAEPFAHALLDEYYTELGGTKLLYIMGTDPDMTMETALKSTEANGVMKLIRAAGGDITMVAIAREASATYNAGTAFLDKDVQAAVTVSKATGEALQKANTPVRFLIEGIVANETAENDFEPNTATNGFACVVLGGTNTDGHASVGLALARAAKYGSHVKLGAGSNGSLSATQMYIGSTPLEEFAGLETLHDAGFLTFMTRPGAAGYYFGRDNTCADDDFRILAHGRVIDRAQRIAAQAYLPFVEEPVKMAKDGSIEPADANQREATLDLAIRTKMSEQISDCEVVVPIKQDVINTSTVQTKVKILPLGYGTWLEVSLGLAASL